MQIWVRRTEDTVFRPTIQFVTLAYSSCSAQQESALKECNVNVEVLKQKKKAVRKVATEL